MNILCPESVSAKWKKVIIRKLLQGQKAATQLKVLLEKPFEDDESLSSKELVASVLRSFTEALSVITSSSEPGGDGEVAHQNLLNSGEDGSPLASGDSGESRKRSSPARKGGRGCYQRRKGAQTRTTLSHTTNDNYAWRKYGQKGIQNSKFPRSYFRCSHKLDQGCKATKQVQLTQENPDMYQIMYIGIHTCKATPNATHLVTYSSTGESFILNSDPDSKIPNEQDHHISSPSLTIKQVYLKEDNSSDVTDHMLDRSLLSDLKDFEAYKPVIMPLKVESVNTDSCTVSQHLDIDLQVESVHFGTDFHFDESQLLSCFD
ncbi:WRKY DNA-binding transcription factor 70-like [Gastrolobium bilobum]|uniref:WRKY DNA-binding transcription factor 70-like n=1 Tax=Gastrolobium bilobum TaxID=150636 RepID=UPI002AB2F0A3|nr:WRKY DNA-binding transcription factor 70-like [Gastrolobium bilobum]